jgi:hypothetical protein
MPTLSKRQPAAGGRPLVAGRPWAKDLGSATPGHRATSDQQSGSNRPAATAGHQQSGDQRLPTPGRGPRAGKQPAVACRLWVDAWIGSAWSFFFSFFFF